MQSSKLYHLNIVIFKKTIQNAAILN